MRKIKGLLLLMMGFNAYCQQTDSSVVATNKQPDYIWIFSSPRLIRLAARDRVNLDGCKSLPVASKDLVLLFPFVLENEDFLRLSSLNDRA